MLTVLTFWFSWLPAFELTLGLFIKNREDALLSSAFDWLAAFPLLILRMLPDPLKTRLFWEIVEILLVVCYSTTESMAFLLGIVLKLHDVNIRKIDWFFFLIASFYFFKFLHLLHILMDFGFRLLELLVFNMQVAIQDFTVIIDVDYCILGLHQFRLAL